MAQNVVVTDTNAYRVPGPNADDLWRDGSGRNGRRGSGLVA
jgi:hypothetical protein